jgi:citrate lyase subunit beta/citryl-CoA lyase
MEDADGSTGNGLEAALPMTRSLLLVRAGDDAALDRALACGADAVILDLQGGSGENRAAAASALARIGARDGAPRLCVRINALGSVQVETDLEAVVGARLDVIVLPEARSGADVQHLAALLAVAEARAGLADGATGVVATVCSDGAALFAAGSLAGASLRLKALIWDGEALAADLGAAAAREDGDWIEPCRLARSLTLAAAAAARVPAIDAAFSAAEDLDGLRREAEAARRLGFLGKVAKSPEQVAIVNAVFGR